MPSKPILCLYFYLTSVSMLEKYNYDTYDTYANFAKKVSGPSISEATIGSIL